MTAWHGTATDHRDTEKKNGEVMRNNLCEVGLSGVDELLALQLPAGQALLLEDFKISLALLHEALGIGCPHALLPCGIITDPLNMESLFG